MLKSVHRRGWMVFLIFQVIEVACGSVAEIVKSEWGAMLWVVSFIGLLPGNILSAMLIERTLWNTGITLAQFSLLRIPVMLLINGVVWGACVVAFNSVKRARRSSIRSSIRPVEWNPFFTPEAPVPSKAAAT
jgi:hypothetical protein